MKNVVKVSIGSIAFTLEEVAYNKLEQYLKSLSRHYEMNENGREIIDGIEERIADLLSERRVGDSVVTLTMVEEVINILGKPADIDDEAGETRRDPYNTYRQPKRLFRDSDHKILGGVCSGLSVYFNTDVSMIRLIFTLICILFAIFPVPVVGGGMVIFTYLLLWVIIPKAKTVEQKYAMRGESPNVDTIRKNIEEGATTIGKKVGEFAEETSGFWRAIGVVFTKFFGLILIAIGVAGVIAFGVALTGAKVFDITLNDMIIFFSGTTPFMETMLRITFVLSIFLPFLGMLYGGISMMFNFKSPKWRPGLIIFLIWLISLLFTICMVISSTSSYWKTQTHRTEEIINESDTLYIQYVDVNKWKHSLSRIYADKRQYEILYLDENKEDGLTMILYPKIVLSRNDEESSITTNTTLFVDRMSLEEVQAARKENFYKFSGDTLYLTPTLINKENGAKNIDSRIYLSIGKDTKIIVEEPVYHTFDGRFDYNNLKWKWGYRFLDF